MSSTTSSCLLVREATASKSTDAAGNLPVLLLDDVLSELDDDRQHILMNHIKDKVQTILTTATIEGLKVHQMEHAEIYEVTKGFVTKLNEKKGS